jgi:hypothetical protein
MHIVMVIGSLYRSTDSVHATQALIDKRDSPKKMASCIPPPASVIDIGLDEVMSAEVCRRGRDMDYPSIWLDCKLEE